MGRDPTEGVVDGNPGLWAAQSVYCQQRGIPDIRTGQSDADHRRVAVRLARHIHDEAQRSISVIGRARSTQTQPPVFVAGSMAENQHEHP